MTDSIKVVAQKAGKQENLKRVNNGMNGEDIMKNILVTGGAGFIGSNFVKYINVCRKFRKFKRCRRKSKVYFY